MAAKVGEWETSLWKIGRPPLRKFGDVPFTGKMEGDTASAPPPPENIVSRPCVHENAQDSVLNPQTKFFSPTFLRKLYRYFFNMIFDISWNIIDGSFFNSFDCNQIKLNQIIYLAIKYMYRWIFIINIS